MAFVPRLTEPSTTDKYWIQVGSGGYNRCIYASGSSVLPNCFSGDTEIVTRDGVVRLDSIVDKEVQVLSKDGVYRTAIGGYYGKQRMYRVEFLSGDSYVCTGNHRWYVRRISYDGRKKYEKMCFKTTLELNGQDYIPYVKNLASDMDRDGIIHGFIYGDGSYYNGRNYTQANLCGDKREYMKSYFSDAVHTIQCSCGTVNCYPYPTHYKSVADISSDLSYLRGFIAGLIASDGCIDRYGSISISTAKKDAASEISNILSVLGYKNRIYKEVRDTNFKKDSTLYLIRIRKSFIPSELLLNPKHKERFLQKCRNDSYTRIKSVTDLGYEDDVYCVSEPETHTMTLVGGILTGQCVGYSYGRFMEIMGATSCKLSTRNAGLWYGNTEDGYERGKVPRLGAVICWSRPGQAGHVAIVEQINPDGSIVTSNSAWQGKRFYTQTLKPPYYTWSSNYHLQGFIYNPKGGDESGKVSSFISTAKGYVAKTKDRVFSELNIRQNQSWSAAFVIGCANKVGGILDVIIPNVTNPSEIGKLGVQRGMGKYIEGNGYGGSSSPEPGDILLKRVYMVKNYPTKYDCDKAAIVTEVNKSTVQVVEGDVDGSVMIKSYNLTSKEIAGYFKPDWAKVYDSPKSQSLLYIDSNLYDTENTKEDAVVREVGYVSDAYTPTLSKSGVRLSVVNYTTLLASFFSDVVVQSGVSNSVGQSAILDGVTNQKARIVIEYLISKGLNAAAAVGIAGNIKHESNFKTDAVGDHGTSFGICQWHNDRGVSMKRIAGSDWANNLTGQLDYLWYELTSVREYKNNVLVPLQRVSNTESGAREAADIFVRKFEKPRYVDTESVKRQNSAVEFWKEIVLQLTAPMQI